MHKVRGELLEVLDDEITMEDDEEGEKKIDALGRLIGCESQLLKMMQNL